NAYTRHDVTNDPARHRQGLAAHPAARRATAEPVSAVRAALYALERGERPRNADPGAAETPFALHAVGGRRRNRPTRLSPHRRSGIPRTSVQCRTAGARGVGAAR